VCTNAGVKPQGFKHADVPIRGRDQPMTVFTVADPTLLASLLDEQAEHPAAQPKMSAYDLT
jgi:hypothetical protein